jgi:hypothetical protein
MKFLVTKLAQCGKMVFSTTSVCIFPSVMTEKDLITQYAGPLAVTCAYIILYYIFISYQGTESQSSQSNSLGT